jgi:hypothetical protein
MKKVDLGLGLWFLALVTVISYHYRYDLGLSKPKFKAGDCVVHASVNEFRTAYLNYLVLQVGKTDYKLRYYDDKGYLDSDFSTDSIEYIDGNFKNVTCPERAQ